MIRRIRSESQPSGVEFDQYAEPRLLAASGNRHILCGSNRRRCCGFLLEQRLARVAEHLQLPDDQAMQGYEDKSDRETSSTNLFPQIPDILGFERRPQADEDAYLFVGTWTEVIQFGIELSIQKAFDLAETTEYIVSVTIER